MNRLEPLWLLKQLSTAFDRADCPELQQLALSPSEALMLVSIANLNQEYCYATELHRILGLSRPAVSSTMKRLREKGYIGYQEDDFDDRKKKILLTDQAKEHMPALRQALEAWTQTITDGLSQEELDTFFLVLQKMRQNL